MKFHEKRAVYSSEVSLLSIESKGIMVKDGGEE
jgi:hypothetical protein